MNVFLAWSTVHASKECRNQRNSGTLAVPERRAFGKGKTCNDAHNEKIAFGVVGGRWS